MLWQKESNSSDTRFVHLFSNDVIDEYYAKQLTIMEEPLSKHQHDMIAFTNVLNDQMEGNKLFASKLYVRAIECYNRSLCHAEEKSERMAMAYKYRATCFFHMKMYDKCLVDIGLAEELKCSDLLKMILEQLRTACFKGIESKNDEVMRCSTPKLSTKAHENFPGIANGLEMAYNNELGHHFVANSDIDVGQTLMVQQVYISILAKDMYRRCNICGKDESVNLIPCGHCSTALFCSTECASVNYHKIECGASVTSDDDIRTTIFKFVIRTINRAFLSFDNVNEFIAFVERCIVNERNQVLKSFTDEQSKYEAFLKVLPEKDFVRLDYCENEIYFTFKFLMQSELGQHFDSEKKQRFLSHLIWHHLSIALLYGDSRWSHLEQFDQTLTPLLNFINFSCTPNVVICLLNDCKVVTCVRPIRKGEPIFVSLAGNHLGKTIPFMDPLNVNTVSQCHCDRCDNRSPSLLEQQTMRESSHFKVILQNYQQGRFPVPADEHLKSNAIRFLQEYGRLCWCHEIGLAVECLEFTICCQYGKTGRH